MAESFCLLVPGLCSSPRELHDLLLSPTYVNEHDLHLTLYAIPLTCFCVGRSFGFLNILHNVSSGLRQLYEGHVELSLIHIRDNGKTFRAC